MKKFLLILMFSIQLFSLTADEFPYHEVKDLRIEKLLPNMTFPLAIDPALPKDFTMSSIDEKPDLLSGIIWGEKKDLDEFVKNPEKNKSTVILVRYSGNVTQEALQEDLDPLKEELLQSGFKSVEFNRYNWGSYPVVSLKATTNEDREIDIAWVGLNVDGGWVLLLNFIYPTGLNKPNSHQLKIWNNFLESTKQLPEREFLLLNGIDLEENYTILSYKKAEIKAYAEELKDNKEALIVIRPLTKDTSFTIKNVSKTFLGTHWHYGDPCVKIEGEVKHEKGNETDILDTTITVLLKSVDKFSNRLQKAKNEKGAISWEGILTDYENREKSITSGEESEYDE